MPDRIPIPDLTFRQRVTLRALDRVLWMAVAATLMGVAFIILAVGLVNAQNDKAAVDTCRSRIAGEVSQAQADVSVAVGDGLRALRNQDVTAAAKADRDYVAAKARLGAAKERRERSEEICA
jgi:hypothetical protein